MAVFGEDVLKWNRDIEALLKAQFDLSSSTSLQEKIFWSSYIDSLRDLENQIQSEEVKFVIAVLKKKNKLHLSTSFEANFAGVKKKIETATEVSNLFKNLPIQEMMTSQTIE